jgi:hypothetical protein
VDRVDMERRTDEPRVYRRDDNGDLRGNRGSEAAITRAHGGADGDSPASWTQPLGDAVAG